MGAFAKLGSLLSGNIGDTFAKIADAVHLDPTVKAQMAEKQLEIQAACEQADKDFEVKLNQVASDNIKVETSSNDAFVRRARPAFLWAVTIALFFNMVAPLLNHFFGGTMQPMIIDSNIYSLFRDAFLGYTVARTVEKIKSQD